MAGTDEDARKGSKWRGGRWAVLVCLLLPYELEYNGSKRVKRCWREGKGKEAKAERLRLGRATLPTTTATKSLRTTL